MSSDVLFIGLGNMGLHMAINLVKAGHVVTGHDLVQTSVDSLVAAGGKSTQSLTESIKTASVIVTMLPASQHVKEVCLGEKGLLSLAKPGTLIIDSSTISPEVSRELGKLAENKGIDMLDAPVSGGTFGAEAGTLTFMVGGTEAGFARAKPYIEKMGKAIYHAGGYGSGQTVKVCNNMLLGITMIGTAEALQLGIANGLDPKVLTEIISKSSGSNWALINGNPCPGVKEDSAATRGYSGGFGTDLMLKDLGLAVENAISTRSTVTLGAVARNLYDMHSKAGSGKLDYASIFKMLEK
jgi:3-hydroxyisobutyrate dehydrogenase